MEYEKTEIVIRPSSEDELTKLVMECKQLQMRLQINVEHLLNSINKVEADSNDNNQSEQGSRAKRQSQGASSSKKRADGAASSS